MAAPRSAGILLYRKEEGGPQVLLIHPGGPFWSRRQAGAWMIPKGGVAEGESAVQAALREFEEETGMALAAEPWPLCRIRQAGGKIVEAFAAEGNFDTAGLKSLHFEMEWPRKSGRMRSYPEADDARWMDITEARRMILPSQLEILDCLEDKLNGETSPR